MNPKKFEVRFPERTVDATAAVAWLYARLRVG
jgi:hypothetical protein